MGAENHTDKVETVKSQDTESSLSNMALDLLRSAAVGSVGGVGGVVAGNALRTAEAAGAVGGAALRAAEAAAHGAAVVRSVTPSAEVIARGAAVAGAVGFVGGAVGEQLYKENKKEIKAVTNTVIKEAKTTTNEIINHMQKRPLTAAIESLFPPLLLLDAKLRKN